MAKNKLCSEVDQAALRLLGRYCFSCQKHRPMEAFSAKNVRKCTDCLKRYSKPLKP